MGFNIDDKPNNISKNDFITGLGFDLWGNYSFANGAANPATTGREMLLFFREVKQLTETWSWVPTLNSLLSTYGTNNFRIVAILYDSAGVIDATWLYDQLSAMTVDFSVIRDDTYLSSITKTFIDNFGASVTNPFYYLINKYCRIREKTLGMITGATVSSYLTGPTILSTNPVDGNTINNLKSIIINFNEEVKKPHYSDKYYPYGRRERDCRD